MPAACECQQVLGIVLLRWERLVLVIFVKNEQLVGRMSLPPPSPKGAGGWAQQVVQAGTH